jgi:hypothetical protein
MKYADLEKMFTVGRRPKRLAFLKPEYNERVKARVKQVFPELFSNVQIEVNNNQGTLIAGEKASIEFTNSNFNYYFPIAIDFKYSALNWKTKHEDLLDKGQGYDDEDDPNVIKLLNLLKDIVDEENEELKKETRKAVTEVYETKTGQSAEPGTGPADLIRKFAGIQNKRGGKKTLRRKNLRSSRKNK